jgi:hypothetical protein
MTSRRLKGDETPYEPTAWMRGALRDRMEEVAPELTLMVEHGARTIGVPLVGCPVGEGEPGYEAWSWTCDRCDQDCQDLPFYTGTYELHLPNRIKVLVGFGLCASCLDAERPGWRDTWKS